MPEIRFTEEDHAFAREFVDRLEQSGVAGTVREFLSKEDAEFILFQSERKLRNSALMMRLAEAVISTAVEAGLAESADTREARAAHYAIHYDNFDHFREDCDRERQYALTDSLPPNPDQNVGGSVLTALEDKAIDDMEMRTGLTDSLPA
jgi:hypothetical protein